MKSKFRDVSWISVFALQMFEGEFESLLALEKTGCVRVPHPIRVLSRDDGDGDANDDDCCDARGALLVMEYLNISSLGSKAEQLGADLAM